MVLTDREIEAAIEHKQIIIDPKPNFSEAGSSTAVDLKLSNSILQWKKSKVAGVHQAVSPGSKGFTIKQFIAEYTDRQTVGDSGYEIAPGDFVLGWTNEHVEIPFTSRLAARVEGRSSLGRLGLGIHVTAPTVHSGFAGQIQLEICNHGSWKIVLLPGMKICQLIFETTLGMPSAGYSGQFQGQKA